MKMAPILVSRLFKRKIKPGLRPVCPDSQVLAVADEFYRAADD